MTATTHPAPGAPVGHPWSDPGFAPARLAELDAVDAFPTEACAALDRLGFTRWHVPSRHGGTLANFETGLLRWRELAGRDLTVAVAHGKTFLGSACVWVAGNTTQARWLAREVLSGTPVAWALTERDHGSDLLAGEVSALATADGWQLTGEKWLINNATRAPLVCVLARTDPAGGPRGFSLFLVDKRNLTSDMYHCLPKVHTHGIRGADISGIRFTGAPVGSDALIGTVGAGLATVSRALQLTRTLCASLSLGAADHALTLVARFAADRVLYGRRLLDLPHVQATLADTYTGLLVAEVASRVAARTVHTVPGELPVTAAVVKGLVPELVDGILRRLGEILGARALLTEVYADGAFAKLVRDHRIVGIFDGSTTVNRATLVAQFPALARGWARHRWDPAGLAGTVDLASTVPPFDPDALELQTRTGCGLVQSLPAALDRVPVDSPVRAGAERLVERAGTLHMLLAGYRPNPRGASATAFWYARRYELIYAGAACLHVWLAHRDRYGGVSGPDDGWLAACLDWVLARLGTDDPAGASWSTAVATPHPTMLARVPELAAGVPPTPLPVPAP